MAHRFLQLGSNRMLQLGSLRLLELGRVNKLGEITSSPVIDLFAMVNTMEDPYAGTGLKPPTVQAAAVAERLRTIQLARRREIHGQRSVLSGVPNYDVGVEMAHLRGVLAATMEQISDDGDVYEDYEEEQVGDATLGKKRRGLFKKILHYAAPSPKTLIKSTKSVAHKTLKVVKSPAFLAVAGVVVNVIPGIGQVASGLLLAASMSAIAAAGIAENAYKKKVEAKKTEKKNAAAQAAADAQTDQQLTDFYKTYGAEYLAPLGYNQQNWDAMNRQQKLAVAQALSNGTLQPWQPVNTDAAIAQAYTANKPALNALGYTDTVWAALPATPDKVMILQALAENNLKPYQTPQAAVDMIATAQATNIANGGDGSHPFQNVPPDVQAAADAKTPALVDQINAVGVDNFNATATKAVGQAAAVGQMADGAGASFDSPQGTVAKVINDNANAPVKAATAQAKDDLLNSAAITGDQTAVAAALNKGTPSSIPWTPIIIGTSVVGTGIGLYLALSRRGR